MKRFEVVVSAIVSGLSVGTGDALMQYIERWNDDHPKAWDPYRTMRFGILGFTWHGPFFHMGFKMLDKLFGSATNLQTALKKMLFGQVTLSPAYLGVLFPYLALMEGKSWEEAKARTRQLWWPTYLQGMVYWPLVITGNFMLVPAGTPRVFCSAIAGVAWNGYLSAINHSHK